MRGIFITFEGIEGSGKTTQIGLFTDFLKNKGHDVLLTREPGGTIIGDQIREILLSPANTSMLPKTELLLYAAGRAQHIEEKIVPALKKGKTIICDRYADASTAYQGAARLLPKTLLVDVHKIATGGLKPDITFLLDLPAKTGLTRARSRNQNAGKEDRFENEELGFHEKVREGYLKIAKAEPERVVIINAENNIEKIFEQITDNYRKREKSLHKK